mmetsp:Transcript_54034/g.173260  ORF Transcript_54034/g.173260 Transcript_54034/m.173260 type:complete len:106 (-) Transcript_54034:222-539(-)
MANRSPCSAKALFMVCSLVAALQGLAAPRAAQGAVLEEDEASFMQVGMSAEPRVRRRTGRDVATEEEPECEGDLEEDGAVLMQSSVRERGVSERWEELDFDDASL